jgi:hypothetical protein
MTTYLQISGDPTMWMPAQVPQSSQLTAPTVSVPITAPIIGTLLISSKAASIALVNTGDGGGVPSDFTVPVESLYVPTGTGVSQGFTGYQLPAGTNLAQLQTQIATLMTEGTSQTVTLGDTPFTGVVVLNGATLPFVVLASVNAGSVLSEPSGTGGVPSDATPRRDL